LEIERLRTGVRGFDELIEGGIPRGFFVAVVGEPGTGKTVFCIHYANTGLKEGDKVIYLTTEESRESIIRQAKQFSMDFESSIEDKKMIIIDALLKEKHDQWSLYELNVEDAVQKIIEAKKTLGYGRTRLIIDSMSAFWIDKPAMARKMSYYIKRVLYKWDMTALLVSQYAVTSDLAFDFGVEHVADGIIRFKKIIAKGRLHRLVLVEKMRQTNHDAKAHYVKIEPGKGMSITGPTIYRKEDVRLPEEVVKRMEKSKEKARKSFTSEPEWP